MIVHFIGAGPGAADLITVRGLNLIRACPVVLYAGSLVPGEIVAEAPDGARVVFQSYRDGNNEIYLMDADGGGQVRLTRHPAEATFPTFSPNGTRVLFQSGRDGGSEFFSMRVDGSDVRRVTTGAYYQDGPSAWSPFPADPANSVTPTDTLLSSSR